MKKESLWSLPFVMMILISVFDSMGHMMLQFMISSYAIDIGIAEALAATLVSVISISSLLMRPVAGRLVDALNKKRLLIASLAGLSLAMVGYLLSFNFVTLLLARLIHGLCYGITTVASVTIAGSLVPRDRIGSGIALYGMGNSVSVIFATKIGQIIYGAGGARALFSAGLFCALCALALAIALPLKNQVPEKKRFQIKDALQGLFAKEALPYAFMNALFSGSQAINSAFMVIFFGLRTELGKSAGDAGITLMIWGIAIFIVRPLVGKLYDKLGFVPSVSLCMSCSTLYMVVLALSPSPLFTYLATLLIGGFGGSSATVLSSATYESAPAARKGAANSTQLMGSDIGTAIGGVLCGWSVAHFVSNTDPLFRYRISWLLCCIPLLIAIAFAVLLRKKPFFRAVNRLGEAE
ncbi:MAG: MFS transporter [Oscillospiraceae bacterium]|nr:MFS transporter [Oscillospiraceae bacterium]